MSSTEVRIKSFETSHRCSVSHLGWPSRSLSNAASITQFVSISTLNGGGLGPLAAPLVDPLVGPLYLTRLIAFEQLSQPIDCCFVLLEAKSILIMLSTDRALKESVASCV